MKLPEIIFPLPLKLLQVYVISYAYLKQERRYSDRKDNTDWNIMSHNGYVKDGKLYLPDSVNSTLNIHSCKLVTIEDHSYTTNRRLEHIDRFGCNRCFDLSGAESLNFFTLKMGDELEFYLDFDDVPRRDKFKVCELKLHEPVEVKINSKSIHWLHGTERLLDEHSCIYEYVGDFDRCYLLREPYEQVRKIIPQNRKVVDLLKPLWM